jgi:hypothetical protein
MERAAAACSALIYHVAPKREKYALLGEYSERETTITGKRLWQKELAGLMVYRLCRPTPRA